MTTEDLSARRAPAGTLVRFAVLIAAACGVTVFVYLVIFPPGLAELAKADRDCRVATGHYPSGEMVPNVWRLDEFNEGEARFVDCMTPVFAQRSTTLIGAVVLLAIITALLYVLLPRWRTRRGRLAPLTSAAAPELTAELDALMTTAGLRRRPVFLVDPVNPHAGGLVFGTARRPYVCLDAGLVTMFATNPEFFRAVVLHELAHLRNNDVPITYLTIALWRSFLLVTLVPFVAIRAADVSSVAGVIRIAGEVAALSALVYLSRNGVLRARERHADVRAAGWLDPAEPRTGPLARPEDTERRWAAVWKAMLGTHPSARARRTAMASPALLLRPGFWEAVAVGAAIQLTWSQVTMSVTNFATYGTAAGVVVDTLWGLATATFIVVTGLRAGAFHRTGGSRWPIVASGLGFAAGVLAGSRLTLLVSKELVPGPAELLALLFLSVQVAALAWWVERCASRAIDRAGRWGRRAAWSAIAGTVGLVCVLWLNLWASPKEVVDTVPTGVGQTLPVLFRLVEQGSWTGIDEGLSLLVAHPLLLVISGSAVPALLVPLWAVPTLLRRADADHVIRSAWRTGLLGFACWLIVALVLRAVVHRVAPEQVRTGQGFGFVLAQWEIATILLAQLLVAGLLAARRTGLAAVLFGAMTTGLGGTLGTLALRASDGCVPALATFGTRCPQPARFSIATQMLGTVVVEGTIIVVVVSLLAAFRRPRPVPDRPTGRAGRICAAVVAAVSLAVALPGLTSASGSSYRGAIEQASRPERSSPLPDSTQALETWARGGGYDRVLSIADAIHTLAQHIDGNDLTAIRASCVTLAERTRHARTFPLPPGENARQRWDSALTALEEGTRQCLNAIGTGTPLDTPVETIARGGDLLVELLGPFLPPK